MPNSNWGNECFSVGASQVALVVKNLLAHARDVLSAPVSVSNCHLWTKHNVFHGMLKKEVSMLYLRQKAGFVVCEGRRTDN